MLGRTLNVPRTASRATHRQFNLGISRCRGLVARSQAPPKTGQHTVEAELAQEALSLFFDGSLKCTTTPTSGGVNNVVQYVETSSGERYILRIYNNGNKSDKASYRVQEAVPCKFGSRLTKVYASEHVPAQFNKTILTIAHSGPRIPCSMEVRFEHAILAQLAQQKLSFQVPRVLPSKTGQPHMLLSSGAECCVFEIIPGSLAKTTSPEEVGRATGELNTAMGKVKVDMEPPVAPYFDLFNVHHAIKKSEVFYNEVATNPDFNVCREDIDFLTAEIRSFEQKLVEFKAMGLPLQLIHGDLHYDNVMVVGDRVSGLLDFEFCSYDWRAMELAVALSKYVGEAEPLELCERFVQGFVQHGQLNREEIEVLPDLINLRIFSNTVYFTGRAIAGEDSLESLTSRAGAYAKRVKWVNANREAIKSAIKQKMLASTSV